MNLDNARQLKNEVFDTLFGYKPLPYASADGPARTKWVHPKKLDTQEGSYRSGKDDIALGIVLPQPGRNEPDYRIGVFTQTREARQHFLISQINQKSRGEVEVIHIGRVRRQSAWHQDRRRPLVIGCSVGHFRSATGTLGCFVRHESGGLCLLSNNHVLANLGKADPGDAILQPGKGDGGRRQDDRAATLYSWVDIRFGQSDINYVDAALAAPIAGIDCLFNELDGLRMVLAGVAKEPPPDGIVHKIGRSSGPTMGRIRAIDVDNIHVAMSGAGHARVARFDGQIVIEGHADGAFSKAGDSGSVVMDTRGEAIALVFAGSEYGGRNNRGLTYANPIGEVLTATASELYLG